VDPSPRLRYLPSNEFHDVDVPLLYCHGPLGTSGPTTMPRIEDQRRASVTYAWTSAFSELDHQLIGHPSPNVRPLPTSRPLTGQSRECSRRL
jgi:hypothetical protein